MDLETIRGALGLLQQDAESEQAWSSLKDSLAEIHAESRQEILGTLTAARLAHAERGEWHAVAALMPLEVDATHDVGDKVALLMELGRVRQQELLDEPGAMAIYGQVLELDPEDEIAAAAIAESDERRATWREMAAEYLREAAAAPDEAYRAAMLMRSAEVEWRFADDELDEPRLLGMLAQAAEADPKNSNVQRMLERIYRRSGDYHSLAAVLERWAKHGDADSERVAAAIRLARLYTFRLRDAAAAAAAYELVLDIVPNHTDAMEALVSHYSQQQNWDKLVQLYEGELEHLDLSRPERAGDMLQIAMLHWKKRESLGDAALWFDRIRTLEPTNGALLEFYREYCAHNEDEALLLKVLQGAQRVLPEGKDKQAITAEIAKLAENQQDAQKAIEQYKALLRQDPENRDARGSLKSLYRKTQGYNQLVDLLRHELEALPEDAADARLEILREVAGVYREHLQSDTSLVSALNQILQVAPEDATTVRELIGLYEKLGRWRDLLANQQRLAELTEDAQEQADLLRAAGKRWLSQFSNVQNATAAFEALLRVLPNDREARDALSDLYRKRRAWPDLYALYESEVASLKGPQRLAVMKEMASLAAERLGQPETAARLYREILEVEPGNLTVLDSLERHAERSKDWATLADALAMRVDAEHDTAAKINVLQKLGNVCEDQLQDRSRAIAAWRRVLELQPGHARAVRVLRDIHLAAEDYDALSQLYESQQDFEGLADVLSSTADRTTAIRTKIDLSYRAAQVYEEHLAQPERAFRSYERILAADPMDSRAARALLPLYEDDEKWARLPALYELLVSEASSPDERFELYSRLYQVTAQRLSDRDAGVAYARKAYEVAPTRPEALVQFSQACEEARQWEPFVEAVEAQLQSKEAAPKSKRGKKGKKKTESNDHELELTRRLELSLADTYEQRLDRPTDAAKALKRVLQTSPTDVAVAERLSALCTRLGDTDELRWLFGFRAEHAVDEAARLNVLHEWATFESDKDRAADLYRRILEARPDDEEALRRLPELLLDLEHAEEAAEVLERHTRHVEPGFGVQLELRLAEISLDHLRRPEAALEAALRSMNAAVEIGSDTTRAVEVLQRLVEVESTKRRAAEALAAVYRGADESRREADALTVLLSLERDSAQRLTLFSRAMTVYEQLDSHGKAFELALGACREFPEQMDLWDRAAALSAASGRPTELADVYREVLRGELSRETRRSLCTRAAELHEEQLGDPVGATPYLEQLLEDDPSDAEAFLKLKQILTVAQRWDELRTLYDGTIDALPEEARIEVLGEVAMICEEFMDDSKSAMSYYERIIELDPVHPTALEALDRLWTKHERWKELAGLLQRRLELASGEPARELRLRLAGIHLDRLHKPEAAFEHVEDVLMEDLGNARARETAERLLQVKTLKVKASFVLERVYESRDEIRDLVRVLETRRAAWQDLEEGSISLEERQELLRQIAALKNDRLRDDEGALEVFLDLIPIDPGYSEGRAELLEIAARMGASVRVAEALERAASNADNLPLKAEILMQAAAVYEESLDNRERAQALYHQAMVLDPADPDLVLPAARALERIQLQTSDHAALVATLRVQLGMEHDLEARAVLRERIAVACEEHLKDTSAAISAWRDRLLDNPDDERALEALDRLFTQTRAWSDLVPILEVRARLADGEERRRELMRRMAVVYAEELQEPDDAIESYRAMLDEFGADEEILGALAGLLRGQERWDELADTLGVLLDETSDEDKRLDLLASIGDLRRDHLSNPGGAIEAYREVTELRPGHPRARAALEAMLEHDDPLNRKEAATILLPLYEGEGDDERLLAVLVTAVDSEEDPLVRLAGLERAIEVARGPLGDQERAFDLCVRAVRDAVGHAELRPWLERLESLAKATGRRQQHVEVLTEIVPEIFDGEVQFVVLMRVAALGQEELDDKELALSYYRRALEVQPDSDAALAALERLYDASGDTANLLEVIERRAEIAPDDDARKQLLSWRARLLDEKMDRPDDAIAVLESILDISLDARAIESLEALYTRRKRFEALIELYRRQLGEPDADRAALHIAMAKVAFDELGDSARAFDELEAALHVDAHSAAAVVELERLMRGGDDGEQHARAAGYLEPIYLARGDYDRVMETIEARLETADPMQRRELLQRLAQLHEEQKEDYRAALETVAKLLHEDLSDEDTIAELERLAKVSDSRSRLVEVYATELAAVEHEDESTARLCRRCGELYRELGEMDRALTFYRRALAFEPESVPLFEAVDGILGALERHQDRIELHRQALEHRFEPDDRLALLHTIAELLHEQLGDKARAIDTYIEALELNPDDPAALDTLSRLYYETERFEELYELVLKRAELASDERQAITFRLALAKLSRNELGDPARAVDQLEEIVRLEPTSRDAIAELESLRSSDAQRARVVEILTPLYEQADDWKHLIKLNEDRFDLAADSLEKVNVLRQTAQLWEERGRDASRALQALVAALQLEPDDIDVRMEFERLAELTGSWDTLSSVYAEILEAHTELASARDYWLKLAHVHDGPRDDPRAALLAFSRVHELEPGELSIIERMEALATLLSDWQTLDWVLAAKAELVLDDEERASIWRRVGEGRRDMLGMRKEALEAYEQALELDPDSAFTLDCLIDLYEAENESKRLVELYQRRVDVADPDDVELAYQLLLAAAEKYEKDFSDRRSAIEMLIQAGERKPQDQEILARLHRLYLAEEQWPELLDNLRAQAEAADAIEVRVRSYREMGDLLVRHLEHFDEALDAYATVLQYVPSDEHARARVMDLGEQHEDLRERVAEVLLPALINANAHAQRVDVLELRLSVEGDPHTRAQTLREIASVTQEHLTDADGAKRALLRAMAEVPDDLELHARIEELCQQTQDWSSYAEALGERAQSTFDAELARDLFARLGHLAETRLEDPGRAIEAYRRAVEQVGDEPDLLLSLDRLYATAKNWTELVDVLERRTSVVDSDPERAMLYYRLAVIQLDEFGESGQGLGSLRTALELDKDLTDASQKLETLTERRDLFEEAAEILEDVYRSRGTTDKLGDLYEKRVRHAETPGERIEMRRGLARVLEEELHDPAGAQRVLQDGLADDPADPTTVTEIERLAELSGGWSSAAEALQKTIADANDLAPDVGKELCLRLAGWYANRVNDNDAAERALERAFQFDPTGDDVLIELEALQQRPGRELARVETLRARARLQLDDGTREELYRAAVQLAQDRGEAQLVEAVLREVIEQRPDSLWALRVLSDLEVRAGNHQRHYELLLRMLDVVVDADEIRELRHRAAALAREQLSDAEAAIDLLTRALDDDPLDAEAASGLREMYAELGRHRDLAALIERVIDITDEPTERARARLSLARLQHSEFSDPETAVETLRASMEEDPSNSEVVVLLSQLYEELGQDEHQAELLSEQISAAQARGDRDAELNFEVRLGEIYASKLGDTERAIEAYRRVLSRDAGHSGAISALVRLCTAAEDWQQVTELLERQAGLVQGAELAEVQRQLGDAWLKVGDTAKAFAALETALELEPDDLELRARLRTSYEGSGAWAPLARLLTDDAHRAPDDKAKVALLRRAAGIYSGELQDQAQAASVLEEASRLSPGDREILLELCDAYSASGRSKDAISALEQVVESYGGRRSKELAEIHRRLANAFLAEQESERAAAELDKAFRIEPGNVGVLRALGMLSLDLNDLKRAQQMFRALLLQKLGADSPITKAEVFYYLAVVHERLGEKDKARQMVDRSLQADPELAPARELGEQLKA